MAQIPMPDRQCGDCQLCCRLLAVRSIGKLSGEKCRHQKFGKGCAIYHTPMMPQECTLWSCAWLTGDDTADISRPDRAHYVIDIMLDYVQAFDHENGSQEYRIPVTQIWVDPKYPEAHRDPALRAFLERRGEEGVAAIIRYDAKRGFVLFPPSMSGTGDWLIPNDQQTTGRDHSAEEIIDTLSRMH